MFLRTKQTRQLLDTGKFYRDLIEYNHCYCYVLISNIVML